VDPIVGKPQLFLWALDSQMMNIAEIAFYSTAMAQVRDGDYESSFGSPFKIQGKR
jgi:hypothetical protein